MSPIILLSFLIGYFIILVGVSYLTSKNSSDNSSFFIANRNSKWYLVTIGMIGTAISGVTFISVPGAVLKGSFGYFQFILGNAVGFLLIVFNPPLKVYSHISARQKTIVTQNGTFHASKINFCRTIATRYNRNEEPITLETRKMAAPLL